MSDHILVAYGTRLGSTADVSEAIGMCLEQVGAFADVRSVDEVTGLGRYQAVILGSAIRGGSWLPEVLSFLQTHQETLSRIPVAYFTVCLAFQEDTPENWRMAQEYHLTLLQYFPEVHPVSIGVFGGAFREGSQWEGTGQHPAGDFRNWSAIRDWALSVTPMLTRQMQPS